MGTSTAFISEIHFRSTDIPPNEFIEIVLLTSEDPADYTVSFYQPNGTLQTGIPVAAATNGEIRLDNASVISNPDPEHPEYTIYRIVSDTGPLFTGGGTGTGEARAVALTNTETNTVIDAYTINGGAVTAQEGAAAGTTTTPSGGAGQGQSRQWDIDGNASSGTYTPGDAVVCFEAGTLIRTLGGARAAGSLAEGDLLHTLDGGCQPIRWLHRMRVSAKDQRDNPNIRAIRIAAGSLGPSCPRHDLLVSRQHRIMLRSRIAARMFGVAEVLVNAGALVGIAGISVEEPRADLTYVHFLLDGHQIVLANGAPCETLLPGEMALAVMDDEVRQQLDRMLRRRKAGEPILPARPILQGRRRKHLLARHVRNARPLIEADAELRSACRSLSA